MPSLTPLTETTYAHIAKKAVGYSGIFGDGELQITEGFPVFTMIQGKWDIHSFTPTGLWHFQVTKNNVPAGYLRARIFGQRAQEFEVCGAFASEKLALGVERSLNMADELAKNNEGEARLLVAPFYQLTVLWLYNISGNDDSFLIAYAPEGSPILDTRLLSTETFFSNVKLLNVIKGRRKNQGYEF